MPIVAAFHDASVHKVAAKKIQCDEIWSFCYAKSKNVAAAKAAPEGAGNVWTFTALDANSKMIVSWLVGARDGDTAYNFMCDLKDRLANKVQLTTDGFNGYRDAVGGSFGSEAVDYAMLVKLYSGGAEGPRASAERRYSPATCIGAQKSEVFGDPRQEAYQHVLYRASEPYYAYVDAALYPPHQCVLQEIREPLSFAGALFRLV